MTLETGQVSYSQESDSCDESDMGQEIEIKTSDSGGGKYLVISTNRWAIDSVDEFVAMLADATRRLMDEADAGK